MQKLLLKKMFYKYLQHLKKDTLASQVFEEQIKMKFPGIANECWEIAHKVGIYSELQNKKISYNEFKTITKKQN